MSVATEPAHPATRPVDTLPLRTLYARVVFTGTELELHEAINRRLDRRMQAGGLSDKHRAKAWRRIRGARIGRIICAELQGIARDMASRTLL